MGAHIERPDQLNLNEHQPSLEEYELKHCGSNFYFWEHYMDSLSLLEFPVPMEKINEHIQMYLLRNRHNIFVSSMYFKKNEVTGKASVFYERVFTNLEKIENISFEDSLQFYFVGLKGFDLLYRKFGYFEIEKNMFHITKNKKAKIWCNKDISRLGPENLSVFEGCESDMVKKVLKIIEQKTEHKENVFMIAKMIRKDSSNTFSSAIQKFREICRREHLIIPEHINCFDLLNEKNEEYFDEYMEIKENDSLTEDYSDREINPSSHLTVSKKEIKKESRLLASFEPHFNTFTPVQSYLEKEEEVPKKIKGLNVSMSLQKQKQNVSYGYQSNSSLHPGSLHSTDTKNNFFLETGDRFSGKRCEIRPQSQKHFSGHTEVPREKQKIKITQNETLSSTIPNNFFLKPEISMIQNESNKSIDKYIRSHSTNTYSLNKKETEIMVNRSTPKIVILSPPKNQNIESEYRLNNTHSFTNKRDSYLPHNFSQTANNFFKKETSSIIKKPMVKFTFEERSTHYAGYRNKIEKPLKNNEKEEKEKFTDLTNKQKEITTFIQNQHPNSNIQSPYKKTKIFTENQKEEEKYKNEQNKYSIYDNPKIPNDESIINKLQENKNHKETEILQKYTPTIDKEIWEDLLLVKKKYKKQ